MTLQGLGGSGADFSSIRFGIAMARDNFPEKVIRKLRDRVAHRCSNPSCRVPTSAPHDTDAVTNIGKAAHICAASLGGPRYDPSMTAELRKSFANGIWLCANHADEIDRDVIGHPVELLRQWKIEAEVRAKTELGRPQPKASDAVEMLTQALTGAPKSFLASSIHNAHVASAGVLEKLDPRFKVTSSFDPQNGARFVLSAREHVDVSLRMEPDSLGSIAMLYSRFLDHGIGFEVDAKKIKLEGSPLLSSISEMASGDEGKLQIGTKPTEAVTKVALLDPVSGRHESLDDVQGDLVVGLKSYTFSGTSMGGLQSLTFTMPIDSESVVSAINLKFNFEKWRGLSITKLPWFSKVVRVIRAIEDGWELDITLEISGERLLGAAVRLNQAEAANIVALLKYTKLARELSDFLCVEVPFDDGVAISGEQVQILTKAVETARGYSQGIDEFIPPARLEMTGMTGGGVEVFNQQTTRLGYLSFTQPTPWAVMIFGTHISMPDMVFTFNHCRLERAAKEGMRQKFEIFPEQGFSIGYRFDIPK